MKEVRIVFDAAPGPGDSKFIEVETPDGKSIRFGAWRPRADGNWDLVVTAEDLFPATVDGVRRCVVLREIYGGTGYSPQLLDGLTQLLRTAEEEMGLLPRPVEESFG